MDRFFAICNALERLGKLITGFLAFPAFILFTLMTGVQVSHYVKTGIPESAGLAAVFTLVAIYFAIDAVVRGRK